MTDPLRHAVQAALGDAYRIESELGGGGMSRLFAARDTALSRDVVVKVLPAEETVGASADRFRREVQLIAKLQHPHIVSILTAGVAAGSLFYVMPRIAGESLRARLLREGPLPVRDVTKLLGEVLDALAFAHGHGVIHRDIKPENILISAGHAVVADFGIAKALADAGSTTSIGMAVGTPAYMAPEQALADPATDHRADLYASAVVAYELIAGTPPFTGSAREVVAAHVSTAPTPLKQRRSDVPDALAELIMRALAKEPAHRPATAGEMLHAVTAAMTPTATIPAGAAAPFAGTGGRGRFRRIVLGVAALLIATAGVLWGTRSRVPVAATVIAVMPLSAVSDTSLARLGQELASTLSTNLDGVDALRTVDAMSLLARVQKMPSPLPLDEARKVAGDFGAGSVLQGTLLRVGDQVRASVTLTATANGEALATVSATAAPGDIVALTDSLTWAVLRQVWRRGAPPSPVLTGIATNSLDALRAFLDGERKFHNGETDGALSAYRLAFERDTLFAQAYMRHAWLSAWALRGVDTSVTRRRNALLHRLPEREQAYFATARTPGTIHQRLAAWKQLAAKYPDYPLALTQAVDIIVHNGPIHGIPVGDAAPMLDQLERLMPDHMDTRMHRAMVEAVGADPEAQYRAARALLPVGGDFKGWARTWVDGLGALAGGNQTLPDSTVDAAGREIVRVSASAPTFLVGIGSLDYFNVLAPAQRLAAVARLRENGIYQGGMLATSHWGEGLTRIASGDWERGLSTLRKAESSPLSAAARIAPARTAAMGAWLGAVSVPHADSMYRAVVAQPWATAARGDAVELTWADGVIGVVGRDEGRVRDALDRLSRDTLPVARYATRALRAFAAEVATPGAGVDSLMALSDRVIQDSSAGFASAELVNRLIVGRALRNSGDAQRAERYLMFLDASNTGQAFIGVAQALRPLVGYERALAFEQAGDTKRAVLFLQQFVDWYTNPPPAHADMVADAKQRLAKLTGSDKPRRIQIP